MGSKGNGEKLMKEHEEGGLHQSSASPDSKETPPNPHSQHESSS